MKRTLFCCLMATALYGAASVRPQQLRCEYRVNPVGIDVAEPRLSWILTSSAPKARGLRQTAYRILAASSSRGLTAGTGDLWDTGKVESDQSIQVGYRGRPLGSGAVAFWKVQVWDQAGQASEWSQPAEWSMGLLHAEDWKGRWIGREESGVVKDPGSAYQVFEGARWIWDAANAQAGATAGDRYFRESFTIPANRMVIRAICVAGADSQAEVFVNGESIATESNAALPAIRDVTRLIHSGDNLVAIRANHARADRPAGLMAAVRVEFASGEPLLVQTGSHWRASAKPEQGWEKPGYPDTAWQPAKELGNYGMAPWGAAGFVAEHRLPARLLRKEFDGIEEGPAGDGLLLRSGTIRALPERRQGGRPRSLARSHGL